MVYTFNYILPICKLQGIMVLVLRRLEVVDKSNLRGRATFDNSDQNFLRLAHGILLGF